jgi:YD repeat-containing protein
MYIDTDGSNLYATDAVANRIYKLDPLPPSGPSGAQAWGGPNQAMIDDATRCTCSPVDLNTGAQFDATTDVAIPGRGIPLEFTRTYDTRRAALNGRLGYGWADSYDWKLTVDTSTTLAAGDVTIRQDNGSQNVFHPNGIGGYAADTDVLASLVKNPDNTWVYTVRQNLRYIFNSTGQLTAIKDLNDTSTMLAYDGSGRLSTVTDPAGRTLTFTYDTSDRIQTITDPASRVLTYTYDTNGDLTQVTNLAGGHWDMTYAAHLLTVMADPRGNHVDTTYAAGRVTEQADKRGKITRFDYGTPDVNGDHTTTVTRPAGTKETYTYVGARVGRLSGERCNWRCE